MVCMIGMEMEFWYEEQKIGNQKLWVEKKINRITNPRPVLFNWLIEQICPIHLIFKFVQISQNSSCNMNVLHKK